MVAVRSCRIGAFEEAQQGIDVGCQIALFLLPGLRCEFAQVIQPFALFLGCPGHHGDGVIDQHFAQNSGVLHLRGTQHPPRMLRYPGLEEETRGSRLATPLPVPPVRMPAHLLVF